MENAKDKRPRFDVLTFLITGSSLFGIVGYYVQNDIVFFLSGWICAVLFCFVSAYTLARTAPAVRWLYFFYGVVFALLLIIGCLITRSIWPGLLLGICLIGICQILINKCNGLIVKRLSADIAALSKKRDEPINEAEDIDLKPILLDETAPQSDRIREMSEAFDRMYVAFTALAESMVMIQYNGETMKALARYQDSGLWKQDFEAMERGELDSGLDPYGVLTENRLCNLLKGSKVILKKASELKAD